MGRAGRRFDRGSIVTVLLVAAIATAGAGRLGQGPLASRLRGTGEDAPAAAADRAPSGSGTTAGTIALDTRSYDVGDCVTWGEGRGTRRPLVVPCEEPHRLQVSGSLVIAGPDDPYPGDAVLDERIDDGCRAHNERLLGGPWDPFGRYVPYGIVPLPDSWEQGNRELWCGLAEPGRGKWHPALPPPRSGPLDARNQAVLADVGACEVTGEPEPVPCDGVHDWEVTGTVDLGGVVGPPPETSDLDGWSALVGEACDTLASEYLGHQPSGGLAGGWIPIEAESWDAGQRLVTCTIGRWADGEPVPLAAPLRP